MMRGLFTFILILFMMVPASFLMCDNIGNNEKNKNSEKDRILIEGKSAFARLKAKADSAKIYCQANGLSIRYCFLIDFSIHSGKHRFFVWDFAKDTIKYQSLCCHGYGQKSTQKTPVFSNIEGSHCSSLGRYRVGERSYSRWGINVHYKLHGLEKTNNNAFKRWIVLHSHTPIPEAETYPTHLPLGWSEGCPVISDEIMQKIDTMLKDIKKPFLLWIYV